MKDTPLLHALIERNVKKEGLRLTLLPVLLQMR